MVTTRFFINARIYVCHVLPKRGTRGLINVTDGTCVLSCILYLRSTIFVCAFRHIVVLKKRTHKKKKQSMNILNASRWPRPYAKLMVRSESCFPHTFRSYIYSVTRVAGGMCQSRKLTWRFVIIEKIGVVEEKSRPFPGLVTHSLARPLRCGHTDGFQQRNSLSRPRSPAYRGPQICFSRTGTGRQHAQLNDSFKTTHVKCL